MNLAISVEPEMEDFTTAQDEIICSRTIACLTATQMEAVGRKQSSVQ